MSDGFLTRWALRKEEARAAERAARRAEGVESETQRAAGDLSDPASAAIAARLPAETGAETETKPETGERPGEEPDDVLAALPPLETLTPETDITLFMRSGVPAVLRNAALRRMWSLDPSIRDFVSEAREYAYDWNTPGGVPGLGPLLPTDDVKAMLNRILNGRPDETAVQPLPDTAPAASDGGVPARQVEDAQIERRDEPAPNQPRDEGGALPSPAETEGLLSAAPDAAGPPAEEAFAAKTSEVRAIRPRLRRHGGAMPS